MSLLVFILMLLLFQMFLNSDITPVALNYSVGSAYVMYLRKVLKRSARIIIIISTDACWLHLDSNFWSSDIK